MYTAIILFSIALIIIGIAAIAYAYLGIKFYRVRYMEADTNLRKVVAEQELNLKDIEILDSLINTTFDEYRIFNIETEENLYLNEERIQAIVLDMMELILQRISVNLRDKLSLIYASAYIDDLIYNRIRMIVLNYTIEINGNYRDEK